MIKRFLILALLLWPVVSGMEAQTEATNAIIVGDTLRNTDVEKLERGSQRRQFVPQPMRAVWYSALFPGLGQVYNRKYWKLPLIIGGFAGIYYGYSWNSQNYNDYAQAYMDIVSGDPTRKSYMDLLPIGTDEKTIDKSWLTGVLKSRKDNFQRNRDFCIIGMVLLYGAAIIDAYVDASLFSFDISPNLSMRVDPTLFAANRLDQTGVGMRLSVNF